MGTGFRQHRLDAHTSVGSRTNGTITANGNSQIDAQTREAGRAQP